MDLSIFIERMQAAGHTVTCEGEGRYSSVFVDGERYGTVVNDAIYREPLGGSI